MFVCCCFWNFVIFVNFCCCDFSVLLMWCKGLMLFCSWSCSYRGCHQSTVANRSLFASSMWYQLWSCAPGRAATWTCINSSIQSLGHHTWVRIQGTSPPWLSKLTWVEWHSMGCIYSQAQESRHPVCVWALCLSLKQGGWGGVQAGNRVLGWKGLWSLGVKVQVWGSDILVYLSLWEWVTKAKGQVSSVCAFLCLLNNRIWTDTDMLPVCHFYSLIFCHFCLRSSGASQSPRA